MAPEANLEASVAKVKGALGLGSWSTGWERKSFFSSSKDF